jgi:protein-S-isoprenylcysteine O-methyltransferase Ste14
MAWLALALTVAWFAVVAGARAILHARRTGAVALPPPVERGSPSWWARILGSVGAGLLLANSVLDLLGWVDPIPALEQPAIAGLGIALVVLGTIGTVASQAAMGPAWRPDVDPASTAPLVTRGPFAVVRNPILSSTFVTMVGFSLLLPSVVAGLMLAAVAASMTIQVRRVEEPFLLDRHGDTYRAYAARTGRFIPGVGRVR